MWHEFFFTHCATLMMGEAGSEGSHHHPVFMCSFHDVIMMPDSLLLGLAVEQNDATFTSCLIYCNYRLPVGGGKTPSCNYVGWDSFWTREVVMGCTTECSQVVFGSWWKCNNSAISGGFKMLFEKLIVSALSEGKEGRGCIFRTPFDVALGVKCGDVLAASRFHCCLLCPPNR